MQDNELLQQLAEIEGFNDTLDLLEAYQLDSVVPGICTNLDCGYSVSVEPDCIDGWCEICEEETVKSAPILAGII